MAVQQATSGDIPAARNDLELLARKPQTYWGMAVTSLKRDRLTLFAFGIVGVIALLALFAGVISNALGVNPNATHLANKFQQPYLMPYIEWRLGIDTVTAPEMLFRANGVPHWLGTDQIGRDVLSRLLYGGRISLSIALVAAAIAMIVGMALGTVSGYFGGKVDDAFMWLINTFTSIPDIYLLIIINAIFRPSARTLSTLPRMKRAVPNHPRKPK